MFNINTSMVRKSVSRCNKFDGHIYSHSRSSSNTFYRSRNFNSYVSFSRCLIPRYSASTYRTINSYSTKINLKDKKHLYTGTSMFKKCISINNGKFISIIRSTSTKCKLT